MADVGLLTPRTTIAHSVYITPREIARWRAPAPASCTIRYRNLKLKNGVAPLLDLKRAGVNLALGCDNCSCSDCQNLFQAMKMFTLLAAGMDAAPTGVRARTRSRAATLGGAHASGSTGRSAKCGPE